MPLVYELYAYVLCSSYTGSHLANLEIWDFPQVTVGPISVELELMEFALVTE